MNLLKGLINNRNSCSFDCFLTIFIFSIEPILEKYKSEFDKNFLYDNKIENKYELYLKFIEFIKQNFGENYIKFYDSYDLFNKLNKCDLYELKINELFNNVPIVINYRILNNNKNFCFKYSIKHFCTGKCKFSNQLIEIKITNAFIDIPLTAYNNPKISTFSDLMNETIFMNINTICNEESCYSDDDKLVNFYVKKYDIIEFPPILSINTNVNNLNELLSYKDFINKIFVNIISTNNIQYELIAFVTQPYENHYVSYFRNMDIKYNDSLLKWYKYDDLNGNYNEVKTADFGIYNIRSSEAICLLVYKKII